MAEPMSISEESDSKVRSKGRDSQDKKGKEKKYQVKRSDSNLKWLCSSSDES